MFKYKLKSASHVILTNYINTLSTWYNLTHMLKTPIMAAL